MLDALDAGRPAYVREAFAAGASGYMLKEAADTEVVQAVREVAGGGRYVHPTLGARLLRPRSRPPAARPSDPLSDREREVLRLLALGHTNQEIAKRLFISVRTAETHRAHIMQKLGLRTRAELVRYALVNGLLDEREARAAPSERLVGHRPPAGSPRGHFEGRLSATSSRGRCRPSAGRPGPCRRWRRSGSRTDRGPGRSIFTSKTPPPPAGTSTVWTLFSACAGFMSPST